MGSDFTKIVKRIENQVAKQDAVPSDPNNPNAVADPNAPQQAPEQPVTQTQQPPSEAPKEEPSKKPDAASSSDSSQNIATQSPLRQAQHAGTVTQRSQFAEQGQPNPTLNTQQQFGHQFSSQLPSQQALASRASQAAASLMPNLTTADLPLRLQQLLQRPPSDQNYRAFVQDPFFQQGPLKNTPLAQKLQEQAKLLNQERQAMGAAREPLSKNEVMQLFHARNQLSKEQKDRFKDIIKYEMARTRLEQMKKVQTIRYQTDAHDQPRGVRHATDVHETRFDRIRDQILDRLSRSTVLSKFETLLKKVLTGLKLIPDVPDGAKARFAIKTNAEWQLFFQNLTLLENTLTKANVNLNDVMEVLFRGLFQKGADGQWMLVADLAHLKDGELLQNKFAQILLADKDLAALLKKMTPGDVIDKALLKKLGEEIEFIRLAHLIQSTELTEAQRQEVLKQYRRTHSEPYTKKIEAALLANREDQRPPEPPLVPFVYAGLEPPRKFRRAPGNTKLWIYLLYTGGSFAVALGVYLLLRWVL